MGNTFLLQKRGNLSDNSKEATDPEKDKKATPSSSFSDHDVFEEGLDSSSCTSILFDYLKNLESKVNKIFANTSTLKENQIKREKKLTNLAERVNFLSEKFHEFEKIVDLETKPKHFRKHYENYVDNTDYEVFRQELAKAKDIKIRSKCNWYELGKKSSKFFLNLEKH